MFYKNNRNGKIIPSSNLKYIEDILWYDVDFLIKNGYISNIEQPGVIDFIRENNHINAICAYKNTHNSGLNETRKMVSLIAKDMGKINKNFCKHSFNFINHWLVFG